jgi:hypothetical protein
MIKRAVGLKLRPDDLREIGRRVIDLERLINQREGLTRSDDTLPRRYFEDPMPAGMTKGHYIDREKFADLLTRYYRLRGWDDEGRLSSERTVEIQKITSIAHPPERVILWPVKRRTHAWPLATQFPLNGGDDFWGQLLILVPIDKEVSDNEQG